MKKTKTMASKKNSVKNPLDKTVKNVDKKVDLEKESKVKVKV